MQYCSYNSRTIDLKIITVAGFLWYLLSTHALQSDLSLLISLACFTSINMRGSTGLVENTLYWTRCQQNNINNYHSIEGELH